MRANVVVVFHKQSALKGLILILSEPLKNHSLFPSLLGRKLLGIQAAFPTFSAI